MIMALLGIALFIVGVALGLALSVFLAFSLITVIVGLAGGIAIGANLPTPWRRKLVIGKKAAREIAEAAATSGYPGG